MDKPLQNPIVSVVVAVKNGAVTLQRCIDSFAGQSCLRKEIIIIDGGSDDGTKDVILSNAGKIAYWESKPDNGISHAWNKALQYTTGEWIIFLGADDFFYSSTVLETFCNQVASHPLQNGRIVYGQVNLMFSNEGIYETKGQEWTEIQSVFFSEKMMIPHQACFHHHSVFEDFGYFDKNFKIAADYDLLLKILKHERPLFLPGFIVTTMSFGGISAQIRTLLDMQKEFDRALIQNGFKPKGFKRRGNFILYRLVGFIEKYAGEKVAKMILDAIRIVLGRRPVWTRK